jgi:hypothetical protein
MSAPLQSQTATAAMSHHSTIDLPHCLTIAGHMPQVCRQDEREFSPGFSSFSRGESPPRGEPAESGAKQPVIPIHSSQ